MRQRWPTVISSSFVERVEDSSAADICAEDELSARGQLHRRQCTSDIRACK